MSSEPKLCLVRHINIDILEPSKLVVCDYLSLLAGNGIRTTIQNPIRKEVVSGNLVSSCLDHINIRAIDASIHPAVIRKKKNKKKPNRSLLCRLQMCLHF